MLHKLKNTKAKNALFVFALVAHTLVYVHYFLKTGQFNIFFFLINTILITVLLRFEEVSRRFNLHRKGTAMRPSRPHCSIRRINNIFGPCGSGLIAKIFYTFGIS